MLVKTVIMHLIIKFFIGKLDVYVLSLHLFDALFNVVRKFCKGPHGCQKLFKLRLLLFWWIVCCNTEILQRATWLPKVIETPQLFVALHEKLKIFYKTQCPTCDLHLFVKHIKIGVGPKLFLSRASKQKYGC